MAAAVLESKRGFAPFGRSLPPGLALAIKYIEEHGLESAGLFTKSLSASEYAEVEAKVLSCAGDVNVLARKTNAVEMSGYVRSWLANMRNCVCTFGLFGAFAAALSTPKDLQIPCVRRVLKCLPPGHKLLLVRLTRFLVLVKGQSSANKLSSATLAETFGAPLLRTARDNRYSQASVKFMSVLLAHFSPVFKKGQGPVPRWTSRADQEKFHSKLRDGCNELALNLITEATPESSSKVQMKRSSRRSVRGWDDVFTLLNGPGDGKGGRDSSAAGAEGRGAGGSGAKGKPTITPQARELGDMLYNGQMDDAERFVDQVCAVLTRGSEGVSAAVSSKGSSGSYEGPRADGKPHGQGILRFANGDVYEGTFVAGGRTGKGVFTLADGSRYEGDFRNGKPHGKGVFTYANGDVYDGEFENDYYHGKGIYESPSSSTRYEGDFRLGMRHGRGKFTTSKGHTYYGQYDNDVMSGVGIYHYTTGDEYRGEFANGKFNGKGIYRFADDKHAPIEGIFRDGRIVRDP